MATLRERLASLQETLSELYEKDSTELQDQITFWDLTRQENLLMHYGKKRGLHSIGLQTLPASQVSEINTKHAIMMKLVLTSLSKSPYAKDPWTMRESSYELYMADPSYTLKKKPVSVEVFFDNDPENYYPYTLWQEVYYEDEDNQWYKGRGGSDDTGLFYVDHRGRKVYYVKFEEDAARYGTTGQWEVRNKQTVSALSSKPPWGDISSSSPEHGESPGLGDASTSETPRKRQRERQVRFGGDSAANNRGKRRRQGERSPQTRSQRTNGDIASGGPAFISPDEVGSRDRTVGRGLQTRLSRLQEEALDPPVILLKGCARNLKSFRNRHRDVALKFHAQTSSVFKWLGDTSGKRNQSRMLLAFDNEENRTKYVMSVSFPKGTRFAYGNLNSL
ncbi:E2 [Leptonychotes weddellii papillomavirus 2]|uniref:Regulatory protein E2 n=1 Tax=Leptonychotes weddellii papillomavirus 2 TaxID=2077303 RepID=A0A2I8B2M3_9PAPI|nr:E2 [Leptonychotes weddellii papillomavirus 2]AUT11892.1 E2 [Leptonychotes weddellii papillomavirus 2]